MKPIQALAIYSDARIEETTIDGPDDLERIVGGPTQQILLGDGSTLHIAEDHMHIFEPEDSNWVAADMAGLYGGRYDLMLTGVRGPVVVVVGPVGEDGPTDVTQFARRAARRVTQRIRHVLRIEC